MLFCWILDSKLDLSPFQASERYRHCINISSHAIKPMYAYCKYRKGHWNAFLICVGFIKVLWPSPWRYGFVSGTSASREHLSVCLKNWLKLHVKFLKRHLADFFNHLTFKVKGSSKCKIDFTFFVAVYFFFSQLTFISNFRFTILKVFKT